MQITFEHFPKIKGIQLTNRYFKYLQLLLLTACLLGNLSTQTLAQLNDLGSWNIINLKYTLNKNVSCFGEAQLRSLRFYNNFHYYEYKGGVNYKATKDIQLTLGLGSYQTYKEGGNFVTPKNNNEIRIWPQLTLFQSLGKFKIEQRYRLELRWTSTGYRNRFRYRLGITHSFGKQRNEFSPFQVSASNELFFGNKGPYFERNRLLFAFNYKPSKATAIQIGFLHQFDYKINDEIGRNFLVMGFYYEITRKTASKTVHHAAINDF